MSENVQQDSVTSRVEGYDVAVHRVGGKHPDGTPIAIGRWTFVAPQVRDVVESACGADTDVLNACAGKTKLSTHDRRVVRNDLNPERDADTHYDVCEIDEHYPPGSFDVVVFDPPFDQGQADEHYAGMHASDLSAARKALASLVRTGGTIVELGWNTHGPSSWNGWTRDALHIFERGPCLQPVFLVVERKVQTTLGEREVGAGTERSKGGVE